MPESRRRTTDMMLRRCKGLEREGTDDQVRSWRGFLASSCVQAAGSPPEGRMPTPTPDLSTLIVVCAKGPEPDSV